MKSADWNTVRENYISEKVSYLPGTQSERTAAPWHTWSSIYTTEYNRTHGTIVLVSKQRECVMTIGVLS